MDVGHACLLLLIFSSLAVTIKGEEGNTTFPNGKETPGNNTLIDAKVKLSAVTEPNIKLITRDDTVTPIKAKSKPPDLVTASVINVNNTNDKLDILEIFNNLQSRSRQLIDRVIREALPMVLQSEASRTLSGHCMGSILKFVVSLRNMEPWTMQMLDAMGKIPLGLLRGTRASFGDYDECLEVTVGQGGEGKESDGHNFVGKYCSVDIRPPTVSAEDKDKLEEIVRTFTGSSGVVQDIGLANPIKFFNNIHIRVGLCIPSSCSLLDAKTIAAEASKAATMNIEITRCEVKQSHMVLEKHHYIAGCYLFPIAGLTVLATILNGVPRLFRSFSRNKDETIKKPKPKEEKLIHRLLDCFSAVTNGQKILSAQVSDPSLSAIHGLRFFSLVWIIFGHTYSFGHYLQISGIYKAKDIKRDFLFQPIINASFSVDTFFAISGVLIGFAALKRLEETKGRLNILVYYFHRYIRTAPAFMMVTCLMLMGPLIGSGPVWRDTLDPFVNNCRARWWANFFFISYLWKEKDICLPYGWYLSVDMLFYVISPLFVILLFRRPSLGLAMCAFGVLVSSASIAAVTVLFKQPPVPLFTSSEYTIDDYINFIFFKPYTHFAPYCIGIATGYLMYKKKHITLTTRVRLFGWILSGVACSTVLYIIYIWNLGREPQLLETLFYATTSRTIWALGVSWLIVLCAHGYGGAINSFLSWKAFIPLSRLTFMAYLMHPLLMYCFMANLRTTVPFGHYFFVWLFFAHVFTSYGVGFIVSILYEVPFLRLEKLWYFLTTHKVSNPSQIQCKKPRESNNFSREHREVVITRKDSSMEEISLSNEDLSAAENERKRGYDNKGFVCHL